MLHNRRRLAVTLAIAIAALAGVIEITGDSSWGW